MGIGAEFSEVAPKNAGGQIRFNGLGDTINFGAVTDTLENGTIVRVSPYNVFRPGQQILFWLGVYNANVGTAPNNNYITRVRLKPWWARPNLEYREPGDPAFTSPLDVTPGYKQIDQQTFLLTTDVNNRYIWMPSPKRLDVTQYALLPAPPAGPALAPARHSDSLFLDDIWTMDLQDPTSAAYAAAFPAPQTVSRWAAFWYPAHGYALGFTHQFDTFQPGGGGVPAPSLQIQVNWIVGRISANYQESLG